MLNPDLIPLRKDCDLLSIDTTRGSIRTDIDGYIVTFDAPLFDLGASLSDPPAEARCINAAQAEFELLSGCRRLQLAERAKLRSGRVFGWDASRINKTPISPEELSEYKSALAHAVEVKRLTRELALVVESNAASAAALKGREELAERYGLKPVKKAKTETVPMPAAHPTKAPSRARSKS